MKFIRNLIANICCTFTVLSALFGILCQINILENQPYIQIVFTLLAMSAGTSVLIALRELLLPNMVRFKTGIEIVGCTLIILLTAHFAGWLELRVSYFFLILGMVVVVYLLVWLLTWLQSKHDEGDLNALLKKK